MSPPELRELIDRLHELNTLLREKLVVPKSEKLVGWKAILAVSVKHGGPGSENRLRDLCRKRGAPVHVWRGMAAVADEQRFIVWLEGLRVPIGLETLGASGKGWKKGQKGRKPAPSTAA